MNRDEQLIDLAVELKINPKVSFEQRSYVARELIQLTLPHRQPKKNEQNEPPPFWYRTNGDLTLMIKPGYRTNPKTGSVECLGYPSGSIPRLLLFWLNSEVVKTKSRKIVLGDSYNDFLKKVGFNPRTGGGKRSDAKRVSIETERLFGATISFDHSTNINKTWLDMPVAPKGSLWWNVKKPDQGSLFSSWIELGEDFYNCLVSSPVPLDTRILSYFKGSPLGLDISAWLSYRVFSVASKGKSTMITWKQMMSQFGTGYNDPKNFKRNASPIIQKLKILEPKLGVDIVNGGIKITPNGALLSKF